MATKKKAKTTTAEGEAPEAPVRITLDTLRTVFLRALENPRRGVPTLIGPAQWGKTHYAQQWLREATGGDNIVMMNPQTDLPEDVAGWPVRTGQKLSFTNPAPIPHQFLSKDAPKWSLFIDELDKAKEDTLSALLTLLNPGERRLRHTRISDSVPICVAMNEPRRELPEPLVARLLFIPFPPEGFEMQPRILSSSLLQPPAITIPTRPHAPGSYFKLREWLSVPEFQEDEAVRMAVISGLFPANVIPAILDSMDFKLTGRFEEWAEKCTVPDLLANIYTVLSGCPDTETADKVLDVLRTRAEKDPTSELCQAYYYAVAESDTVLKWQFPPLRKDDKGNVLPYDPDEAKQLGHELVKKFKERTVKGKGEE